MGSAGVVMVPERLPQSWMVVSYGARGFAYDWWRTYGGNLVTVPAVAISSELAVPRASARHVRVWIHELTHAGVIVAMAGGLRMCEAA